METKLFVNPHADPSIPSPRSEAVANELRGLSLQLPRHLLPIRERQNVLQLKLQQRRTREELVSQGIMPPLKSSASFHEQRRSLERARTEDYLKRKIRSRPEKSELIRMHILEETLAEPLLQAKQLQLKRARLADDLNDKIAHRPGPMELIHKNILPIHSSIKQAIIETQFPKASGENSSCDEDSNDSLSPGQPVSRECPLGLGTLPSPAETLAGGSLPSPTQVPPAAPPLAPISGSSITLKLTNGTVAASVQRTGANSHIKPKPKSDQSTQRHKKTKDNKPKIKKLKYHQYIPPDQKGDKEPPPHLDSSYAKILHQQQLFLQLQILSQQQQHYNYHAILPAPPKTQTDQQPPSCSSSSSTSTSSPPRPAAAAAPAAAPSTLPSNQRSHSSAPLNGTKPASLPPNLDEMKVAELKSELKLRSLPVSGTKNDLIERLRTYQELNGGGDTTSSPTAGGTTGPGAEGAGRASETAANNNTSQQQQQFHCHQTSSLNADAGSNATLNAATQQQQHLLTCGGSLALSPVSLTPCDHSPAAMSSEDSSFSSDPLGELMSSPLTQLSLQPSSAAQLPSNIKEETSCSTPAPCQFSLKSASLQKLGAVSPAAPTSTTTAPAVIIDKDRMLQEKDKQIEELMRMLRQKQQLVEVLRMQLEHGNREGQGPQPQVLLRVKEEPPDKPSVALSTGRPLLPPQASHEMDVTMVTIKQEAIEEGEVVPVQSQDTNALLQPVTQTQESQEQIQLHPEQKNAQNKPEYVCLQQTALQLAQQQAMQKLLLQQQHNMQKQQQKLQNHNQMLENQQKLCQQRKKKCLKLQQQQQQQKQAVHSQQHQQLKHLQQMQLKQQILLKQQKSLLQQQLKQQQQTKQLQQIQIETKIQLKQQQQQVLVQQKQQMQRQHPPQVPQAYLNQQSGSAPSFSLDLLKSDSTPTLVTDSNGNHFLIALTSQVAGNQKTDACEGKAGNHIMLQRLQSTPAKLPGHNPVQLTRADNEAKQSAHVGPLKQQSTKNGAVHVSMEKPQQGAAHSLSAPPSLQPFFKDQEAVSSGKNTSSPFSQTEVCPSLDVFFSPQSSASIKTPASSPDDKDSEHEDDFIDTILQTGDMSSTFTPTPDPSLDHLSPDFSASSPPPSPLHLLLSPPVPPSCDSPRPASSGQPQLPTNTTEEKQLLFEAGGGRLEDFLESTTGKPLLGVEPGGLLTLIDDLHSQMLCTPSILDHPPSPMDTFSVAAEGEQGLDSMDWLDFTSGGEKDEETPTLAPLAPQTPPCVFSTDFLDSYDLHIHLDSCL